jgi:hypothetical protein
VVGLGGRLGAARAVGLGRGVGAARAVGLTGRFGAARVVALGGRVGAARAVGLGGRGWRWVGGGLGHGPPSSAGSRGWLRCRVHGRLISQSFFRSLYSLDVLTGPRRACALRTLNSVRLMFGDFATLLF